MFSNPLDKHGELARAIGLKFNTVEEGVKAYADACYKLDKEVGIAMAFKDQKNCEEKRWMENVEKLAYLAYEDQCSPANPRVPMIDDIKTILKDSYYGEWK